MSEFEYNSKMERKQIKKEEMKEAASKGYSLTHEAFHNLKQRLGHDCLNTGGTMEQVYDATNKYNHLWY